MSVLHTRDATLLPRKYSLLFILVLLIGILPASAARAHSPHDNIRSVAMSPFYENDQTVFIYVFDELKRSTDSGVSWQNLENGLDNNELINTLAIARTGSAGYRIFAATRGDGIYLSDDAGDSWRAATRELERADIRQLAVSPGFLEDQTLAAVSKSGDVFVSADSGETWQALTLPQPASAVSILARNNDTRLLVGDRQGKMYVSDNAFRNWSESGAIRGAGRITALSGSMVDQGQHTVYAGTESGGLYRSVDFGANYDPIALPSSTDMDAAPYITALSAIQKSPDRTELLVTTWHDAAFYSPDGGGSWTHWHQGITRTEQADEFKKPHFSSIAVASSGADSDGICCAFVGGYNGLFRFEGNGGWSEMETRPARNIEGMAVAESATGKQLLALTTYDTGAYLSHDSGATWISRNVGLRSTHLWDIVVTGYPENSNTLFAVSNLSFLTSRENASGWHRNEIAASPLQNFLYEYFDEGSIVMRASRRLLGYPAYTYPLKIAVSPEFADDGTLFLATRYQGVLKSTDRGDTWHPVWGADGEWVEWIRVSPDLPRDGIIAVSLLRKGLYLSNDAGKHWTPKNNGLSATAIRYDSLGPEILQFTPAFATDNTLYFGTADGLYVSTNRADDWHRIEITGKPVREPVKTVVLSPDFANDGTLIVSVKGHGLFRSTDRGLSFSEIAPQLIHDQKLLKLIRFASDYTDSNMLFAASAEEAFVSRDGGDSWQKLARPVRYENGKEMHFTGNWESEGKNTYSALGISKTRSPGDRLEFSFIGKGFTWYGPRSEEYGDANVYIDGKLSGRVNQFASEAADLTPVYSVSGLAHRRHYLTIEKSVNEDPRSGPYIGVDAIEFY